MSTPEEYLASRGARRRSSSSGLGLGADNPSPQDDRFVNMMSGVDTNMNQQLLPRTRSGSAPIERYQTKSSSPGNGYNSKPSSPSGGFRGGFKGHLGKQKYNPFNPSIKTIMISCATFMMTVVVIGIVSYTGYLSFTSPDCGCDMVYDVTETGSTKAALVRVQAELKAANVMYAKQEAQLAARDVTIETLRAELLDVDSVPDSLKTQYKASQKALKGTLSKLHNLEDKMGKSKQCIQRVEKLQEIVANNDDLVTILRSKIQTLESKEGSKGKLATPAPKAFVNAASMRPGGGSILSAHEYEVDLTSDGNDGKEHSASFYHKEIAARNKYAAKLENDMLTMSAQMKSMETSIMRQSLMPKAVNMHGGVRGTLNNLDAADVDSITAEYGRLVARDTILTQRLVRLRESLQVASRELIELKWGEGPHQVEVKVKFPQTIPHDTRPNWGTFIVEMGSLEYTPHTIHYWLSQVALGLWNDSSFVRNAEHVIQADPQNVDGREHIKSFIEKHLPLQVAFQEYSEKQPHDKYSLGVPGRPGGPDWYISTEDNNEVHGPNGQMQYEMPEEADPCFAKVVSGFDVVDRIHAMPIKSPEDNDLLMHVEIASITILGESGRRLESVEDVRRGLESTGAEATKTGAAGDRAKRSAVAQTNRKAKQRSTANVIKTDAENRREKVGKFDPLDLGNEKTRAGRGKIRVKDV